MPSIWKQPVSVASLTKLHVGTTVAHLGIEFIEVGDDFIRARAPVARARSTADGNPARRHFGGACRDARFLRRVLRFTTEHRAVGLDINANHLRSVSAGWVTGIARPVHIGRTTHVWQIEVSNEKGQLTCVSRITMAILAPGEP